MARARICHHNLIGDSMGSERVTTPLIEDEDLQHDLVPVSGVPFERVAMALFGQDGQLDGHMVAICAEPGMGRRDVITSVLSRAAQRGALVYRRNLEGYSPEEACRFLTRKARDVSRNAGPVVIGLDDIPASDEVCVARQARALHRMWERGFSVVFSLAPEARQLIEALPECREIPPSALLAVPGPSDKGAGESEVLAYTRGIPSLARALSSWEGGVGPDGREGLPPSYYDSLGELMGMALRSGLSDEERRLRLSMLLLGRGTLGDLACVAGSAPRDTMEDLRRNAPLFGIARDLESFCCLTAAAPNALVVCLRSLMTASALFPDVTAGCLRTLVAKGELDRAAAVARLPESDEASAIVLERSTDFIERGEVALVRHALSVTKGEDPGRDRALGALVSSVSDRRPRMGVGAGAVSRGDVSGSSVLLLDARRLLRGVPPVSASGTPATDALGRRLATHVGACSLMLRGAFTPALSMLAGGPEGEGRNGLSSALLAMDRELAQYLAGGATSAPAREDTWPEEFLRSRPLEGLSGYLAIHGLVRALAAGDEGVVAESERVAGRFERSGDIVVRVVALIVGALGDLARGTVSQARVRASLATSLAKALPTDYLYRVADLVEAAAGSLAGDRIRPRVVDASRDDLDAVSSLVLESLKGEDEPLLLSPLPDRVPWDGLWLLRLLCSANDRLAGGVSERMPQSWRRAVGSLGPARRAAASPRRGPEGPRRSARRGQKKDVAPIEVGMLGGFSVSVRGQRIPDAELERRNAKAMVQFLVLNGGSAKRYQLVDAVWPECDYVMGFNRAYQTTSSIRASIATIDPEISLISANRTTGEISIDMGLISCDVDEFRRAARAAVDSEDDVETLANARLAERVYAGDLYVPTSDSTGRIATLCQELKALYGDAMVEGSAAALRLGYERTAARFAGNALIANDLREDAMLVLVRALRACGRSVEADRQHRAFEVRVARESARHPRREADPEREGRTPDCVSVARGA